MGAIWVDFLWITDGFGKLFWIKKSVYMSPRCFIFRGRAQRTSERSERCERSDGAATTRDRQIETDRHTDTRKDGSTKKQTDSGKLEANSALPVHLPRQVYVGRVFRSKTLPKRLQNQVEVEARFWCDFGGLLASFGSQDGSQNRAKSEENRGLEASHLGLHILIDFASILDGFLKDFCSQDEAKLVGKSMKNQR